MRDCNSVPKLYEEGGLQCNLDMYSNITDNTTCINWNQYYTNCSDGMVNPFKGAINFDNIFYAWIAIFQVKPLFTSNPNKWAICKETHLVWLADMQPCNTRWRGRGRKGT